MLFIRNTVNRYFSIRNLHIDDSPQGKSVEMSAEDCGKSKGHPVTGCIETPVSRESGQTSTW